MVKTKINFKMLYDNGMATAGHNRRDNPSYNSNYDWHRHFVFNNQGFIDEVEALKELEKNNPADPGLSQLQNDIALKYAIKPTDINRFIIGQILYLEHKTSRAELNMDYSKREFSIRFTPDASKAEVMEQWDKFEYIRMKEFPITKSRRRSTEQPDLIFAIFIARIGGATFGTIFELYSSGKLDGYKGSNSQFKDEESLERYYNKYKPVAQPDT